MESNIKEGNMSGRTTPRPTVRFFIFLFIAILLFVSGLFSLHSAFFQVSIFILILLASAYFMARRNLPMFGVRRFLPEFVFVGESFKVRGELFMESSFGVSNDLELEDELVESGSFMKKPTPDFFAPSDEKKVFFQSIRDCEKYERDGSVRHRGIFRKFRYRITSRFPMGLFMNSISGAADADIIVFPHPVEPPIFDRLFAPGLGAGSEQQHILRELYGEFNGLRPFYHGCPLRLVHWPLSARYQELVVKDFEPESSDRIVIAFHSFCEKDKKMKSPEYALRILSGMFLHLHRSVTSFSFIASFNNWDEIVVDSYKTLTDVLTSLSCAEVTPLDDISPLLEILKRKERENCRVIVFSNMPRKQWEPEVEGISSAVCLDCTLDLDAWLKSLYQKKMVLKEELEGAYA